MCLYTMHFVKVWNLYHFTDGLTKDMREGRGWYAAWEVGRRLLFIIIFYVGINFDSSLVSVSTHTFYWVKCNCCRIIQCHIYLYAHSVVLESVHMASCSSWAYAIIHKQYAMGITI